MLKLKIVSISLFLIVSVFVYTYYQATVIPDNNPKMFLKQNKKSSKKIVACLGDSITHGRVSFDYVKELNNRKRDNGLFFINGGVNSELAYNLLKRLDTIIKCKPDYITILIGTNDAKGTLSKEESDKYTALWNLPQKPELKWYIENLEKIIDKLKKNTDAKIGIFSIPPMSEIKSSIEYRRAQNFSKEIINIAERKNVFYFPLNEKMEKLLNSDNQNKISSSIKPIDMYWSIFSYYILRKSWNEISDSYGLQFLTDNLHLNAKGGNMITDMIEEFINTSIAKKSERSSL